MIPAPLKSLISASLAQSKLRLAQDARSRDSMPLSTWLPACRRSFIHSLPP